MCFERSESATTDSPIRRVHRAMGGAIIGGIVGWVSLQLTVGMVLARNFNGLQASRLSLVWWVACVAGGAATGISYNQHWKSDRTRFIAWGAVASLTALLLVTRIPYLFFINAETLRFSIPGTRLHYALEDIALISAPGALLVGGVLGWFFYERFFAPQRKERLSEPDGA